jgi:ankyrin repeat protein
MIYAADNGHIAIVSYLYENGTDVNVQNNVSNNFNYYHDIFHYD